MWDLGRSGVKICNRLEIIKGLTSFSNNILEQKWKGEGKLVFKNPSNGLNPVRSNRNNTNRGICLIFNKIHEIV